MGKKNKPHRKKELNCDVSNIVENIFDEPSCVGDLSCFHTELKDQSSSFPVHRDRRKQGSGHIANFFKYRYSIHAILLILSTVLAATQGNIKYAYTKS